jgi:hypothetical protein
LQDLNGETWRSSRYGAMPVETMAVPHAWRALQALEREHGESVAWDTKLGRALAARVAASDKPSDPRTYRRTAEPVSEPVEPTGTTSEPAGESEARAGRSWRTWEPPTWVYLAAWIFLALMAWVYLR